MQSWSSVFLGTLILILILASSVLGPQAAAQSTATATATAWVARKHIDLDGDGSADEVRILPDGEIQTSLAAPALRFSTPVKGARITVATVATKKRITLIHGFARAQQAQQRHPRAEAIILHGQHGRVSELWRGQVGPQGVDGEWSRRLQVHSSGLFRYEERPEFARCGPIRMYEHAFDFGKRRFRPISRNPHIEPDTPILLAQKSPPNRELGTTLPRSRFFRVAGVTSQFGALSARGVTLPIEISDGHPDTAWIEGQTGIGHGEKVSFSTTGQDADNDVAALAIIPGHGAAAQQAQYSRIKRALLQVATSQFVVEFASDPLPTLPAAQWIVLPRPISTQCVHLTILEVYPGARTRGRRGDVAISELAILTQAEISGDMVSLLIERVVQGGAKGAQAARILSSQKIGAGDKMAQRLQDKKLSGPSRARLALALAERANDKELELLLKKAAESWAVGEVRKKIFAAALRLGDAAVPALKTALGAANYATELKLASARALGAIAATPSQAAINALISAMGRGPMAVRHALWLALGATAQAPRLAELATNGPEKGLDANTEADLWRACTLALSTANRAEKQSILSKMAARLTALTDYQRLYRLTAAIAAHGAKKELALLIGALRKNPGLSLIRHAVLRRVASYHAADNPHPQAGVLLQKSLLDKDPGVRIFAAQGLQKRSDRNVDRELIESLTDRWPEVRQSAAAALGTRCARPAPHQALTRLVTKDNQPEVKRTALLSLSKCQSQKTIPYFISVVKEQKQPLSVREYALRLVGRLGDTRQTTLLITLLKQFRASAYNSKDARHLAANAATVLGALRDERATELLIITARDEGYPSIQGAAVDALGQLCPQHAKALVKGFIRNHSPQIAIPARRAVQRCNW